MKKLIILDFDGTLADTRELIVRTNQEAMRRMHYPVADEASIVPTIGIPLRDGIRVLFKGISEEQIPDCVKVYREVFEDLKGQIIPALFPHVKETLAALCAQGVRFTVASARGRDSLHGFLRDMGVAPYISYVLGAEDVAHNKPHPEPVLKTLRDLSVDAADALVVGDMPVDIRMGLGAGVTTCGVSYGNADWPTLLAAGANIVIDDFAELAEL